MTLLRSRLQRITEESNLSVQEAQIENLRKEFAHTIHVLLTIDPQNSFNCVMHALHVRDCDFEGPIPAVSRAKTEFIDFLIDHEHLVPQPLSSDGSLVVYAMNRKVKHIGVMKRNSRVESKWGIAHLCEHGLWEVPTDYGDCASFFAPIGCDTAIDDFCEWLKT